jgi:hypothetical protein
MSVQTLSRKPESCETMRQVISVLETRYLSSQATEPTSVRENKRVENQPMDARGRAARSAAETYPNG